jgi:hypothetical protein
MELLHWPGRQSESLEPLVLRIDIVDCDREMAVAGPVGIGFSPPVIR